MRINIILKLWIKTIIGCFCCGFFLGCSSSDENNELFHDKSKDYIHANQVAPLRIPEGSKSREMNSYMDIPQVADGKAPVVAVVHRSDLSVSIKSGQYFSIETKEHDQIKYIYANAEYGALWTQINLFWEVNSFPLVVSDSMNGVIKTQWVGGRFKKEKEASGLKKELKISESGKKHVKDSFIMTVEFLGDQDADRGSNKSLMSANTGAGLYEVHLKHARQYDDEDPEWHEVKKSHAEQKFQTLLLKKLLLFLATYINEEEPVAKMDLVGFKEKTKLGFDGNGNPVLNIHEQFAPVWQAVGIALSELDDVTVTDRDRSTGLFYIEYNDVDNVDKRSWFARIFGSDKKQMLHVRVSFKDAVVQIRVEAIGNHLAEEGLSERLLMSIKDHLG